ncbi:MAG: hypothetical protein ACP5VE_03280 [Chthonomonadales bacterium]
MVISDAKKLVGNVCEIWWRNRNGEMVRTISKIHDATFVPLYGGYLITDTDDIRLDRVTSIAVVTDPRAGEPAHPANTQMPVAA